MNRKFFLVFVALCGMVAGMMTACSETDDEPVEYANWQERNIAYFDSIYNEAIANKDGKWDTIRAVSLNDTLPRLDKFRYIVVHNEGGEGCPVNRSDVKNRPKHSDSVMVYNMGRMLPSRSYPRGYVIEKSWDGDFDDFNPATARAKKWAVSSLIDGYSTALQYMHVGDRWRIYVPYTLAYLDADYNSIPAYSTLVWDVTLLGYYRPGATIPNTDAKKNNQNLWVTE